MATGVNYVLNRRFRQPIRRGLLRPVPSIRQCRRLGIDGRDRPDSEHLFGPCGATGSQPDESLVAGGLILIPKFVAFKHLGFRRSLRIQAGDQGQEPMSDQRGLSANDYPSGRFPTAG